MNTEHLLSSPRKMSPSSPSNVSANNRPVESDQCKSGPNYIQQSYRHRFLAEVQPLKQRTHPSAELLRRIELEQKKWTCKDRGRRAQQVNEDRIGKSPVEKSGLELLDNRVR